MNFAEAANMALCHIYKRMGSSAVFAPAMGDDVACTVIINTTSEFDPGGTIQIADPQPVINYRRADIGRKVKRGETFTVGSTVYTVVSMAHYPDSWTEFEGQAVVIEA